MPNGATMPTEIDPVPPARPAPRRTIPPDAAALAVLAFAIAVVVANRAVFDSWLARFDSFTQFLPWFAYLGERLRAGQVPGWNPHLFSGAPFAGDPQSNWMYLPAMIGFSLLPVTAGFKAMVAIQLVVAGGATYAFGRVLGFGPVAALVAALAYVVGPLLQWTTYCCLIMGEFATWVPLLLLGLELALRGRRRRDAVLPCLAAGVAFSQILAGWVGQGWLLAALLTAAYLAYRGLLDSARADRGWTSRVTLVVGIGAATAAIGLLLGAAGVLPRLAVNAESTLVGGYAAIPGDYGNPAWSVPLLLARLVGGGYADRASAFAGAVLVLALLAPTIARRRPAVPFFAGLTVAGYLLTLEDTPLHRVAFLIPLFRDLHQHDPWRIVAVAAIGPAVLAGATVDALPSPSGRLRVWPPLLLIPALLVAVAAAGALRTPAFDPSTTLVAAVAATALLLVAACPPRRVALRERAVSAVPALLALLVVLQPAGLELAGSWLGWPRQPGWEERWRPPAVVPDALATDLATTDPGGAGAFLQARLAAEGPFRFLGYGGVGHRDGGQAARNYMERRFDPNVRALLVNGRAVFLGLYDVQGYNPMQLRRYAEFIAAANDAAQDYHLADMLPSGVASPLFGLLDLRYVVLDRSLPPHRPDVVAIVGNGRLAFSNDLVAVYERPALPHAWIVHDVRAVASGEALPLLTSGQIDPRFTALVEGPPVVVDDSVGPPSDSATVVAYEPERIAVRAETTAPGLLVLSEIYAEGWRATVDGQPAAVLPTNHVLRGVPLPAGVHTVEVRYEPAALRVGVVVSGAAWAAALALLALAAARRIARRSP